MPNLVTNQSERYFLFLIFNQMPHKTRDERLRVDKLWELLGLDEVAALPQGTPLDTKKEITTEITIGQRDLILNALELPGITTAIGRALRRIETTLLAERESED